MYEFSAIDPYTRILASKLYPSPNSKNAKDFLINHLISPFYYLILLYHLQSSLFK